MVRIDERAIRERGLGSRVHLLGNVAPALVPHLYARAELVLSTSTHEAFGLTVLEGWAADRPVLFPRIGGLEDIAAELGWDDPSIRGYREETWAEAIRALAGSAGARRLNDVAFSGKSRSACTTRCTCSW